MVMCGRHGRRVMLRPEVQSVRTQTAAEKYNRE
jgi:hypothetical protein